MDPTWVGIAKKVFSLSIKVGILLCCDQNIAENIAPSQLWTTPAVVITREDVCFVLASEV